MKLPAINQIPYEKAFLELGQRGFVELVKLRAWLNGWPLTTSALPDLKHAPWSDPTCRYAPSIICRSEAELFGISTPRFAVRIYFPEMGFVNTRRVGPFCEQAQHWLALTGKFPRNNPQKESTWAWTPWRAPARILERSSVIADALLPIPKRFEDGYHILSTRLGKAYGECCQRLPDRREDCDFDASLYIRPIATGGGLCAQSVCFLTTSILHDYTKAVHGLAEVTAVATSVRNGRLSLSGLEMDELVAYFCDTQVGLQATIQKSLSKISPEIAFRRAMRNYLLSGFPIVLPVDMGRMQGNWSCNKEGDEHELRNRNICLENELTPLPNRLCNRQREYTHAILVMGCAKNSAGDFVSHDTARFPFMKGSAEALYEAAAYTRRSSQPMSEIMSGTFVPVVPGEVRMPLTNWLASQNDKTSCDGVMQLADVLQNGLADFPQTAMDSAFRLTRLNENRIETLLRTETSTHRDVREAILKLIQDIPRSTKSDPWIWLQWDGQSAWVWDAEATGFFSHVEHASQALPFLKCAAWKTSGDQTSHWVGGSTGHLVDAAKGIKETSHPNGHSTEAASRTVAENPPGQPSTLTVSTLSSFSLLGLHDLIKHWPDSRMHCEFYSFMQPDADHLLKSKDIEDKLRFARWSFAYNYARLRNPILRSWRPRFGFNQWERPAKGSSLREWGRAIRRFVVRRNPLPKFAVPIPVKTAMERMASAGQESDAFVQEVARNINNHFAPRQIKLIGLATFLPGLADYEVPYRLNQAMNGVRFVMRLAKVLKQTHPDLSTIELVAGSLIYGISRTTDPDGNYEYDAWSLEPDKAIRKLRDSLVELAPMAVENNLKLVVEHEPGPLYVLGNLARLKLFAQLLSEIPVTSLGESIGLNCDVAHWGFLSGFNLPLPPTLENRIFHAHLSSHGRGHYGDAPIESADENPLRSPTDFLPWIQMLRDRSAKGGSKFVSLELEACKYREMVAASLDNLCRDQGLI